MSEARPIPETPSINTQGKDNTFTTSIREHANDLLPKLDARPQPVSSKTIDYAALGEELRVRPDEEIPPPPTCLTIVQGEQNFVFGTLGNISAFIGKAKSRKTFVLSIAIAAATKRGLILNRFQGTLDDLKQVILYFDTEQSRYHVLSVVKRICKLIDEPVPENLLVYALRSLPTQQRLDFIRWHIYNTPNVGLVVIDGVRDLVFDINDNAEATDRIDDLMQWSGQLNIHILTVLHMNKGNEMARGTLGTELQNKAETVASITVDPNDKTVSVVTAEMKRGDKAFEPFAFAIDSEGLPYMLDESPAAVESAQKKALKNPLNLKEIAAIVQRVFNEGESLRYSELRSNLVEASEFIGHKVSKNSAEELIIRLVKEKYVFKNTDGRFPLYSINSEDTNVLS